MRRFAAIFTRRADGSYDEDFAYTDRGRGPSLQVRSEIGADGLSMKPELVPAIVKESPAKM